MGSTQSNGSASNPYVSSMSQFFPPYATGVNQIPRPSAPYQYHHLRTMQGYSGYPYGWADYNNNRYNYRDRYPYRRRHPNRRYNDYDPWDDYYMNFDDYYDDY